MLSLENLNSLSDAPVRQQVCDDFLLLLHNAPSTKPYFFTDAKPSVLAAKPDLLDEPQQRFIDKLSALLAACAIARATDRQFHRTVDRSYADRELGSLLGNWHSLMMIGGELYENAFPHHCSGNGGGAFHRFEEYLPDAARWGREYAARVSSPAYLNSLAAAIATGQPYLATTTLAATKIAKLSYFLIYDVYDIWEQAFPNAGIGDNRDPRYLSGLRLANDSFLPQVRSAILSYRVERTKHIVPGQGGAGGSTRTEWRDEHIYGEKVLEFLRVSPAAPYATGTPPDNRVRG